MSMYRAVVTESSMSDCMLTDKHSVLVWVTCVLYDGDDIGPLLGHIDEVTT